MGRNGHEGIGKPAPLGNDLSGHWSRRINSGHRLAPRIRSSPSPAARRSARDSGGVPPGAGVADVIATSGQSARGGRGFAEGWTPGASWRAS
ncbi:type II toxin-antitoxin system YoeB family toxin [Actinacidiphila sp. bgisy145]|uniref:type II toxin-antitoxin system YoeB family toxin n=1 Tax=Actinacidiphila sp. bgisy145 TaxID=3413792 RepID=UPI003EBB1300